MNDLDIPVDQELREELRTKFLKETSAKEDDNGKSEGR